MAHRFPVDDKWETHWKAQWGDRVGDKLGDEVRDTGRQGSVVPGTLRIHD